MNKKGKEGLTTICSGLNDPNRLSGKQAVLLSQGKNHAQQWTMHFKEKQQFYMVKNP